MVLAFLMLSIRIFRLSCLVSFLAGREVLSTTAFLLEGAFLSGEALRSAGAFLSGGAFLSPFFCAISCGFGGPKKFGCKNVVSKGIFGGDRSMYFTGVL